MDTKIKQTFWSDRTIENLSSDQKLALLWLFTAHANNAGWVECSARRFEFETGSPYEALLSACKALNKGIISHEKGFWVRNYVRHQIGEGESLAKNNMAKAIIASLIELPDEVLKEFKSEYPELNGKIEALHNPLHSPCQGQEKRREEKSTGEEGAGRRGKDNLPTTEPAIRIAKLFNRRLETRWNDREVQTFKKLGPIDPGDLSLLESYYAMERSKGEDNGKHRRDLSTFLNNFAGELDRARAWSERRKLAGEELPFTMPQPPPGADAWIAENYPQFAGEPFESLAPAIQDLCRKELNDSNSN